MRRPLHIQGGRPVTSESMLFGCLLFWSFFVESINNLGLVLNFLNWISYLGQILQNFSANKSLQLPPQYLERNTK